MVDTRFHAFSGEILIKDLLLKVGYEDFPPNCPDDQQIISGANELQNAKPNEISLAANRKYLETLSKTSAGCVIVHKSIIDAVPNGTLAILAKDPHLVFIKILEELYPQGAKSRILKNQIKPKQKLEKDVFLSQGVVLGDNVEIGSGTFLGANVTIGGGVTIGRNCVIEANASIICSYIGDGVIIHSGAIIGTEGFGWQDIAKSNIKIPQLGRVIIQDKVEIGANSTIDRGALGDTTIGEGTKIDNLVQIGHNCNIGRYCLIAATTGLAGSTNIGDNCLLGGGVGSAGHLSVGANSIIHGRAAVTKDWPQGSRIIGAPAQDTKSFWKELAALKGLIKNKNEKV